MNRHLIIGGIFFTLVNITCILMSFNGPLPLTVEGAFSLSILGLFYVNILEDTFTILCKILFIPILLELVYQLYGALEVFGGL
jgi:hypothetical protein